MLVLSESGGPELLIVIFNATWSLDESNSMLFIPVEVACRMENSLNIIWRS